ncbi:MAG: hypothetical protein JXQ85_11845 [Cognatishimia sp.]|uniref:DUF6473 family protein n=1 Tax=Cognatishimia sp. TaxID=2211648 RepID=UPI003B8C99CB
MSLQKSRQRALDYLPCRYGSTRVDFRGPKKRLKGRYLAFLGGSETYGKFIPQPFPDLVERAIGLPCANFGLMNAGIDVFLSEPEVMAFAGRAEVTVIQILGAQNMSNRYYRVHPRRNDRFVTASALMRSVFHDVDFSEFNFTRHMLNDVSDLAAERFSFVREELRNAWCARMRILLERIPGQKVLLWFADHPPPLRLPQKQLGRDPLFVDSRMIDTLRPLVDGVAQVRLSDAAKRSGTKGMVFRDLDRPAAELMLGPKAHEEAASVLVDTLEPIIVRQSKKARH